jgi:branched-chain amino acid transport system substrate-binding protein
MRIFSHALGRWVTSAFAAATAIIAAGPQPTYAADPIKIGVIAQFSGTFADFGQEIGDGIDTYVREHGDTVAGRKIEIIRRDQGGPNPDRGRQLAQELITRDKVDFLAGFDFSPTAFAIAPLITQAKTPTVIMTAATMGITDTSPYFVRFASTLEALETTFATWAARQGIQKCYVAVADFVAGHAAGDAFKKSFTAAGGEIVGETAIPLESLDLAPYVQRIADAKPQAIFLFLVSTKQSELFSKLYGDTGLKAAGTKLLGATDLFSQSPAAAKAAPEAEVGAFTVQDYSWTLDNPLNRKYVADFTKYFGTEMHPDFMSVSAYDGMAAIYRVIEQLHGQIDGDKAMAIFKGMAFESPRGPIKIEPETRDITEPVYIRQIVREGGELVNKEIYTFPAVVIPHG